MLASETLLEFKHSQTSSSSVELNPEAKVKRQKREKKKGVPLFTCNMSPIDNLQNSILDSIYLITCQPSSSLRLATMYSLLGYPDNLDGALQTLNCYSLNDFIRRNKHYFNDYLDIFVTKMETKAKNDASVSSKPQLVLYYYNKKINEHEGIRKAMKEVIDNAEKPDSKRFSISFEETNYFEYHNSLEFIEGRKCFAKVLDRCQREHIVNRNLNVPLGKFQQVCLKMYGEPYSTLLKTWFPKCSGTENIMRKIIFEEIDCTFSSQTKKEIEFRLKANTTIDEICQNLNALKEDIEQFHDKILRDSAVNNPTISNGLRHKRPPRYENHGRKKPETTKAENAEKNEYGESDDELDNRIENAEFNTATSKFKADVVASVGCEKKGAEVVQEAPKIKEYSEIVEKFKLVVDFDLDQFVPMIKEIDVGKEIVENAMKKEMEEEEINEFEMVEKNADFEVDGNNFENEMEKEMVEVQMCSDV